MRKLILVGVMMLGFGLTSTLATQRADNSDLDVEANPERVNSVVMQKKEIEDVLFLNKTEEVKSYDELLRQFDEAKKREDARRLAEFKKRQAERAKQLAEERRQRELAEARAQQLAKIKAEEERKAKQVYQDRADSVKGSLNIEFSYYTARCAGCSGKTATGYNVLSTVYYDGMRVVATDPNVIPTWSIIQFELDGRIVKAIALDRGGAIKGHKLDMLVGTTGEALQRGRHTKKVEVLRYGK